MLKTVKENLTFTPLSAEDKASRGILGRLMGPIASCVKPTRNGRRYSNELWEKAFEHPVVKEMFRNGGLPGELNHPEDRTETDATKIAIMMPEPPVKDKDGQLVTYIDILDTPCGRIAYQLSKYGFKFGISSRGEGEVTEDWGGDGDVVEPDSYVLNGFDLVLLPAVETARLSMVESFNQKKPLKQALKEELDRCSEADKKIMTQKLEELDIDYSTESDEESVDNKEVIQEEDQPEADNNGADLLNELQESIKAQQKLEQQVKALQEQLSVCYTKEERYRRALSKANESLAEAKNQLEAQTQELNKSQNALNTANETIATQADQLDTLNESIKTNKTKARTLTENLSGKDKQIQTLQEQLKSAQIATASAKKELESKTKSLTEALEESKKDIKIVKSQAQAKLSGAQNLVEKYKSIAKTAVDRYIDTQAKRVGVSAKDIKAKLGSDYSFNDIDKICESLQTYKLNVNSLPFNVGPTKQPVKMTIKESVEPVIQTRDSRIDDEIDSTLLGFM